MKVRVENGRISRIEPLPGNRATPEGACLKGLSYVERVHSPERLLHPLRRKQGSESFQRITWDDALEIIAEKLNRFKEKYGPQSVLYYYGSGTKGLLNGAGLDFWRLFGGCTTTYGDLCWPAGLEAARLTLGDNKHNAPWDISNARLIVLWGKNAAETNIHQMVFIDRALEKGARLVVVDPRRTPSSDRAEMLIQPRPGTDAALALAVAHVLVKNGHVDCEFVDRHVLGFDEFERSIADFTPGRAAAITDVPELYIERFADLIGTIKPATINAGFGMQRYTNSGQTMRALIALLALTGNVGKPGAGWIYANLQSAVFDTVKEPLSFYPPRKTGGPVRVSVSAARLGEDILAAKDPPLKMIWVERGNPVSQNPDTSAVVKAFRSLDFRVVVEQFKTDTAREADILLPAKTMFEQSDVIGAYWHPYVQLKQKVIDPPGEVKPETEVYGLLAQKLGLPEEEVAAVIPGPSDAAVEAFLERKLRPYPELTLDRLREGPVITPGHQEVAFSDLVFPTPSGRIEVYSNEAQERWGVNPLPDFSEPVESARRESPESEKYRLYLLTPNTKNRIHSQFNNLGMIRRLDPKPVVCIHPEDARARGITDGAATRIHNGRGEMRVQARFDYGVKPGCLVVTNGWWEPQGCAVNACSCGRETDMGHGAAFHDNLVEIESV